MTANQINYAKLQEDIRTHKTNEAIAERQAAAAEANAVSNAQNAATNERLASSQAQMAYASLLTANANVARQKADQAYNELMALYREREVRETQRHNMASEVNQLTVARIQQQTTWDTNDTNLLITEKNNTRQYITSFVDAGTKVATTAIATVGGVASSLVNGVASIGGALIRSSKEVSDSVSNKFMKAFG